MATVLGCTYHECQWPCSHHTHRESSREDHSPLLLPAFEDCTIGCNFCDTWYDKISKRCFCIVNGQDLGDQSHVFIGGEIRMRRLKEQIYATLNWDCGSEDFELAIEEDQDSLSFPSILRSKEIRSNPRSALALALYKQWLTACRDEHTDCKYEDADGYPKRLVDISNPSSIRVVETGYQRHQYCALSYCWGGREPLMLLRRNEAELSAGIGTDSLPACFLDAVHVARGLGMEYIWIDALNILQYDKEDWEGESARMAGIYADAAFVIIAANSRNPYECFLDRVEHENQWFSWEVPEMRLSIHIRLLFDHNANAAILFPISERAWTYQERLMARRCLVFTDFETTWECQRGCKCECSGDHAELTQADENASRPQMIPSRAVERSNGGLGNFSTDDHAFRYWIEASVIYSTLRMTNPNDKLPAMAGIASIIARATGDTYLAGLWPKHLIKFLLWRRLTYSGEVFERFIAPTWSWASLPGTIRYFPVLLEDRDYLATYSADVLEAKCELTGTNPFGAVRYGHVLLRGRCTPAVVSVSAGAVDVVQPKLTLDATGEDFDLVVSTVVSNEALDFLPVKEAKISSPDGSSVVALQRASGDSYTFQESCSGSVILFWLLDDQVTLHSNNTSYSHSYALILAYSQRESGAYERLGLVNTQRLRGRTLPMPEVSELETKIEAIKII